MRRIPAFLVAVLSLLAPAAVHAGTDRWTPIGPDGGGVSALAFSADGRTAFAGTRLGGSYRSTDGGRSWAILSAGPKAEIRSLAADPAAPARVYAATSEGVFRSDDSGGTWAALNAGLPVAAGKVSASFVVVEPEAPHAVWAITGGVPFRSTDRGATWQRAGAGLPSAALAIAPHPRRAGAVLAATIQGVFRSGDSGRHWRPTAERQWASRVVFDPFRPAHVYAVVLDSDNHGITFPAIRVSDDGGVTWRAAGAGFSGFGGADLVADPFRAGRAWAVVEGFGSGGSLYRTADGGLHWQGAELGSGYQSLAASPTGRGVVLAGRANGFAQSLRSPAVVRTVDSGVSWSPAGAGIRAQDVVQIAADPSVSGALYARGFCCTLWKREGDGRGWKRLAGGLPDSLGLTGLTLDPKTPSTVYQSTTLETYKSVDAGRSWRALPSPTLRSVAVDPLHPSVLYGAPEIFPVLVKSVDGGTTWTSLDASQELYAELVTAFPGAVYANGFDDFAQFHDRLRRSTDGGATWRTLLAVPGHSQIREVVLDPRDPARLWIAVEGVDEAVQPAGGGVWRSTDGGEHWTEAKLNGDRPAFSLVADPRDAARLWAASDRGTVFQSEDGGATWAPYGDGLPPADVYDLQIDPFDADTLYAATRGGSVYAFTRSH